MKNKEEKMTDKERDDIITYTSVQSIYAYKMLKVLAVLTTVSLALSAANVILAITKIV